MIVIKFIEKENRVVAYNNKKIEKEGEKNDISNSRRYCYSK